MNSKFKYSIESHVFCKTHRHWIAYDYLFSGVQLYQYIFIICLTSCILRPEDAIMIYPDLPYDSGLISAFKFPLNYETSVLKYFLSGCITIQYICLTIFIYTKDLQVPKIIRGICQLYMKYI